MGNEKVAEIFVLERGCLILVEGKEYYYTGTGQLFWMGTKASRPKFLKDVDAVNCVYHMQLTQNEYVLVDALLAAAAKDAAAKRVAARK